MNGSISTRERGFSLLEVLIALLVLSVGLLGIAGLQTVSLKFNHQSYARTQATALTSDMVEKIMSNPVATRAGTFDRVLDSETSGNFPYGSCPASCTPAQLAFFDISRWKSAIENPRILPQVKGKIERIPTPLIGAANQHVFKITVTWWRTA